MGRSAGLLALALTLACVTTPVSTPPPVRVPEGPVALRVRALDGGFATLGQLRGQPVLLLFITTWSDVALREVPRLDRLEEKYRGRLAVRLVVLDQIEAAVHVFADLYRPRAPIWRPEDAAIVRDPFGLIDAIPVTVLLDAEGKIELRLDGIADPEVVESGIGRVLARSRDSR